MCGPTVLPVNTPRHVVVAGAGPSGLLLANLLLKRDEEVGSVVCKVTAVESRPNLGTLEVEELRKTHRSWDDWTCKPWTGDLEDHP